MMIENQIIFESPTGIKLSHKPKNIVKVQIKDEQKSISGISTDISEDENTDNKIQNKQNKDKKSSLLPPESKKKVLPTNPYKINLKLKYKTEMCRNWMSCKYGAKCRYAHGMNELNYKQDVNSFYKSRNCKLFHENGQCSYGTRCHFVHENRTKADINVKSKVNFEHLLNHGLNRGRRLPLFEEFKLEESHDNCYQKSNNSCKKSDDNCYQKFDENCCKKSDYNCFKFALILECQE